MMAGQPERIPWFQSSPVPKDGRYQEGRPVAPYRLMFQSSPVPKDGRYLGFVGSGEGHRHVSILARPEGRALHQISRYNYDDSAVSILARPEGRALLRYAGFNNSRRRVSILARPEGRALLRECHPCLRHGQFQSSPVPKDGRYWGALERGDIPGVSILARPEGRALLERLTGATLGGKFQSSPVPKDGRYLLFDPSRPRTE